MAALLALAAAWWAGDQDARTGLPHTAGEVGQLARAFDGMASALQQRQAETRAAEEALRASEERLRLLVEQLPAVIWTTDRNLRFTSSQGAGLARLGLRPNQVVGHSLGEYFRTDDPDYPPIAAHRAALAGESVAYDLELNGRAYQSHVEPLRNGAGQTVGVLGIALDVTERRRAEESIRQAEARYCALFNGVPVGLYRTTTAGRILDANRALVEMLGYPDREALLAVPAQHVYARPEDRRAWQEQLEQHGVARLEIQLRRLDGTPIWVEDYGQAIRDESGQVLYYEGSIQDITERKRAEEAIRALIITAPWTTVPT